MKKLLIATSTVAALGLATAGFAAPVTSVKATAPGAYVGVGAGYGGMVTPRISSTMKHKVTSNHEDIMGFAASVYGGYLWNVPSATGLQLGAEVGYNYYPDNKYKLQSSSRITWKYQGYNVDVMGVAKYNFADTGINMLGKVGAAYTHQKTTVGLNSINASKTTSKILPKVALGVGYDFTPNLSANLMVSYVFGNKPKAVKDWTHSSDASRVAPVVTTLLGVTYHFNV